MLEWIRLEVGRTRKAGRIFLYCWAGLFVLGWIAATIWQISMGKYPDAAAEIVIFAYLFLLKGVWPLWVASAVRKRGGDFGGWFTGGVILGFFITGLLYLIIWSNKKPRPEPLLG
jgi:hypothetical protein